MFSPVKDFTLKTGILKNVNLGSNKEKQNLNYNQENLQRTSAKDKALEETLQKKFNIEETYRKKKSKILRDKSLLLNEKQNKIKNLSKKILKRKSYYDKSGFNVIGKSLKKGLNENRLGTRDEITRNINESKTKILNLKYKLLYGFLDESEIEEDFEKELQSYKQMLKKRQNIDFLLTKQEDESKREENILKDQFKTKIEKYSDLISKDKEEALYYYIEEIIPIKNELFELNNKTLEIIQDPKDEKIHYLYKK